MPAADPVIAEAAAWGVGLVAAYIRHDDDVGILGKYRSHELLPLHGRVPVKVDDGTTLRDLPALIAMKDVDLRSCVVRL